MPTPDAPTDRQLLERAMRKAVDFIHAEGWDQPPTLFGLVPASVIARETGAIIDDEQDNLTLVVQDLPDIGSGEELQDYIARTAWPRSVTGTILAQEIMFQNSAEPGSGPRKARLFSGIIDDGPDLTLLQLRPTEDELEAAGAFSQDNIELLGGPDVAPGVIALLRSTFEAVEG
ncbi:PPA1309 family protein [Corynebacterium pseudokroppenstedtii]|uniref:PPA1309 family protein n=1 Tax=Corynebacterium pseudokroppenstedtii TaxID=2804917 RepID=UPI00307A83B5